MKKSKVSIQLLLVMVLSMFQFLNMQGQKKPNIIVVFTDDISARELPIYNSSKWTSPDSKSTSDTKYRAFTPVLDKMAKQGCYIETAWAATICSPSRAMMMTGRYAHLHKWWVNGDLGTYNDPNSDRPQTIPFYKSSPLTIGRIAKRGGYATFWTGKTQMPGVDKLAFDEGLFTPGGTGLDGRSPNTTFLLEATKGTLTNEDSGNKPKDGVYSTYEQQSWYWRTSASTMKRNNSGGYNFAWWNDNKNGAKTNLNTYGPDVELNSIFNFMERKVKNDKPFFVYHTSHLGHDAFDFLSDGSVTSKWPGTPKVKWDGTKYTRTKPNITGSKGNFKTNGSITGPGIHHHVNYLDYQMSLYLKKLKELGIEDNTLIIFTSDNGTSGFGKSVSVGQKGTHVPFIIYGPGLGITKKGKQDVLLNMSDVLPTIADVVGYKIPCDYKINGQSFWPFLTTSKAKHRDWVYSYQGALQLIRNNNVMIDGKGNVYDVRNTPGDLHSYKLLNKNQNTVLANGTLEASKNKLVNISKGFDKYDTQKNGLPNPSVNRMTCSNNQTSNSNLRITYNTSVTTINTNGTLSKPLTFAIHNIPNNTTNAISVRAYGNNKDVTIGGQVAQLNTLVNINSTQGDVNNAFYKTVTTKNTPSNGLMKRVFTIKKLGLIAGKNIVNGNKYVIAIRFNQGGATGSSKLSFTTNSVQPVSGAGNTANVVFKLNVLTANNTNANVTNAISASDVVYSPLTETIYVDENIETNGYKIVNYLGQIVKEAKRNTSLNIADLPNGVYLLVTDKGTTKFVK